MGKLKVKGVTKSFGNNLVLDGINLIVEEGEFVSILGPSGSGKSTLFNLIGGILVPDEGEILLDGEDIVGKRGSISYTPQSPALFPWRTVLENVLIGQEIFGMKEEKKDGNAWGHSNFVKICHLVAPAIIIYCKRSRDVCRKPSSNEMVIGKKQTRTITIIFGNIPNPNQITRSGAKTIIGMFCEIISSG